MSCSRRPQLTGATCGIAAALTFGVSTPLTKLLVRDVPPLVLASLLYLGAGLGLSVLRVLPALRADRRTSREAPLRGADRGLLAGVIVSGGIVGPLLMLFGLGRVSGVAASLLLNLEAPFSILLAVVLFSEHLGARVAVSACLIVLGAAVLNAAPGSLAVDLFGMLAIAGACLSWALDNNLTQRLSLRDPVAVGRIKGLTAGGSMLVVAVILRQPLPGVPTTAAALLLGAISYGASVVLDVVALRLLGAAREAAFFATAPFAGAVAAVFLLGERWEMSEMCATLVMAAGVILLFREHHAHWHTHEEMEHEHVHIHDAHHEHEHDPGAALHEAHSHHHRHASLTHAHPHVPDAHHRHSHGR
jgi:drug/metabolite transporter (DMT)-like permease